MQAPNGQITSLALVLHEWAANSAKHDALSIPDVFLEVEGPMKGAIEGGPSPEVYRRKIEYEFD